MAKTIASRLLAFLSHCCVPAGKRKGDATEPYAKLFRAMGDETRLEMLGLLAKAGGELCVLDIEKHFTLSQPTISHHLRLLREAGCVRSERRGTWVYYTIDHERMGGLLDFQATLNR